MTSGEQEEEKHVVEGTSPLEWLTAAVSAAMLLSMIGYMIYYAFTRPDGPPDIRLAAGAVERAESGYRVQFTARNDGHSTAAALHIRGVLLAGGNPVEESRATIDYVPEQSERRGGLFFTRDPAQHTLELRSEGYSAP